MRVETERFSTEVFTVPWVRHQHLERYRWAAQYGKGRKVIDVACGSGYGSALMAQAGAVVVDGFDGSEEAVNQAARSHSAPGLKFATASATQLPVPDHTYDLYLSFETIEHVEDDRSLLAEAARVLRPGGLLLLSTPNRELFDPGTSIDHQPFNRFHVREYKKAELEERLTEHFTSVSWFGQSVYPAWYVKKLEAIGRNRPLLAVRLHQARKCLGWPWESPARHVPTPDVVDHHPEVLIALCQT